MLALNKDADQHNLNLRKRISQKNRPTTEQKLCWTMQMSSSDNNLAAKCNIAELLAYMLSKQKITGSIPGLGKLLIGKKCLRKEGFNVTARLQVVRKGGGAVMRL